MIKVGIVGGTGYTGVELLRLLAVHPEVEVSVITSRGEEGREVSDLFPNLRGHYQLKFTAPDAEVLGQCDVVFFATPHGVAQSMVPSVLATGTRVIDLSADFRLRDVPLWEEWYNQSHQAPDFVEQAVYGLPEINREAVKTAKLIACPGCYPTSVLLGLLPLIERDLVDPTRLIANSASGTSGAGRQGKVDLTLAELGSSFKAYAVEGHRHLPEIEQILKELQPEGRTDAQITFVPHLLPIVRGIHSTLYATLKDSNTDLQALYEERFASEPFVDVLPRGQMPQTRSVTGTNVCRLSVLKPQGRDTAVIMVAEDNLTKGSSGQAIQNMNLMFGLSEVTGLEAPAVLP